MASVDVNLNVKKKGDGFKKLRTEAKKTTSGIGKEFQRMGTTIAAGLTFAALGKLTTDTILLTSETKLATQQFEEFFGAGEKAVEMLDALQRGSRGLQSELETMQFATQLANAGFQTTADQGQVLNQIVRRLSVGVAGIPFENAEGQLLSMFSNRSIERADNLGISTEKLTQNIEDMGFTARTISNAGFLQAFLITGQQQMQGLGEDTLTTTNKLDILANEFEDLQVIMGQTGQDADSMGGLVNANIDQMIAGVQLLGEFWQKMTKDNSDASFEMAGAIAEPTGSALDLIGEKANIAAEHFERLLGPEMTARAKILAAEGLGTMVDTIKVAVPWVGKLASVWDGFVAVQDRVVENAKEIEEIVLPPLETGPAVQDEATTDAEKKRIDDIKKLETDFARDVLDINRDNLEDRLELSKDFQEDQVDALKRHLKSVASIQKNFERGEAKEGRKHDKLLKRDLAQSDKSDAKRIADIHKEGKTTRKRNNLDELLDQRLFDFALRNLAAEGAGIAIGQALERREIETEIAAEKASMEEAIADDARRTEIKGIQEAGSERRSQIARDFADEAEERKISLQHQLEDEDERYSESLIALNESNVKELEAINEGSQQKLSSMAETFSDMEALSQMEYDRLAQIAGLGGGVAGANWSAAFLEAQQRTLASAMITNNAGGVTTPGASSVVANVNPTFNLGIQSAGTEAMENEINGALQQFVDSLTDIMG